MSFWDNIEPKKAKADPTSLSSVQPTSLGDVAEISFDVFMQKERTDSEARNRRRRYEERFSLYDQLAGRGARKSDAPRLIEDAAEMFPELLENWEKRKSTPADPRKAPGTPIKDILTLADSEIQSKLDQFILKKRETDPARFSKILTKDELEEKTAEETNEMLQRQAEIMAGAPAGIMTFGAAIAGAAPAAVTDPVNLLTMGISVPARIAKAGFLSKVAYEAALDAGVELVSYPILKSYNEKMGIKLSLIHI